MRTSQSKEEEKIYSWERINVGGKGPTLRTPGYKKELVW
jgi:hypothetical protein